MADPFTAGLSYCCSQSPGTIDIVAARLNGVIMVQFLLASASSSSLTHVFLHCHYMRKCFSIRKVTDLLLKSMQTVVIVQVTEQAILAWQQRCPVLLQALLFLFASITIHSCQEAQTNRLATILLSTCCTKRGSFFHPKKRPVTTFVQLPY